MSAYLQGQDPAANDAPKPVRKAVTAPSLLAMRAAGDKITMLTAYDASFASLMDRCGVEVLLIGDSLGMVCAGPDCSGQVLVMHDLLGVFPGRKARFVRNFMEGQTSIDAAVSSYVAAVKDGSFPGPEHCF